MKKGTTSAFWRAVKSEEERAERAERALSGLRHNENPDIEVAIAKAAANVGKVINDEMTVEEKADLRSKMRQFGLLPRRIVKCS